MLGLCVRAESPSRVEPSYTIGMVTLFALLACTGKSPGDSNDTAPSAPDFGDCTVVVEPGDDPVTAAQTALIEAAEGDVVCFDEATWTLNTELSLTVNNVTVKGAGMGRTVFDFTTQDVGAQGMSTLADGTVFTDFTVMDTPGDGIRATNVNGITWRRVEVGWSAGASTENGAYGIYPVGCDRVLVEDSVIHGARDAGVYVGQSTHILVTGNEVYENVAGIEIENSTDSEVVGNHAHDNTGGILVFSLPGLEVGDGKRSKVHGNVAENNNTENFGASGTMVSSVPAGIGIMVLASDNNEVADNDITGNNTAGVFVISYIEELLGSYEDADYNAYAASNYLHDNRASGNGTDPDPTLGALVPDYRPVPDFVWDGCQDPAITAEFNGNCLSNNGAATYLNADFCGGFSNQATDITAVTCVGEELAGQDL